MNPTTFNQPFEDILLSRHFPEHEKWALRSSLKSPLIMWEHLPKSDISDSAFLDGRINLPFESFRVDALSAIKVRGKLVVRRGNDSILIFCRVTGSDGNAFDRSSIRRDFIKPDIVAVAEISSSYAKDCNINVFNRKTGRLVRDCTPDYPGNSDAVFRLLTRSVLWFLCSDFTNPHFHLCRKSPPEEGVPRSVEWRKAREHYVLIHKSHPANQKEAAGKRVIESGPLHRAAHSRRAHYRMLRSPKFRNKVGQRVWVASAWVGPKEWTDHSGQIYRIVDRPAQSAAA